jgi:hypothetical protein
MSGRHPIYIAMPLATCREIPPHISTTPFEETAWLGSSRRCLGLMWCFIHCTECTGLARRIGNRHGTLPSSWLGYLVKIHP